MNPDSLCAKCAHLIKSSAAGIVFLYCKHRNSMQQTYEGVSILKGFKTCINFKPKEENQQ